MVAVDELKLCPFCGNEGYVQETENGFYALCMGPDCKCSVGEHYNGDGLPDHDFSSESDAIAAWDRRAGLDELELACAIADGYYAKCDAIANILYGTPDTGARHDLANLPAAVKSLVVRNAALVAALKAIYSGVVHTTGASAGRLNINVNIEDFKGMKKALADCGAL